jgi:hypothetical protein
VYARGGEHPRVRAALAALAVCALAAPVIAHAASSARFAGTFADDTGRAHLRLEREQGERTVVNWRWRDLHVYCGGEPTQTSGRFTRKPLRVEHRSFDGRAVLRDGDRVVGKAKVSGTFAEGFESAEGLFRVTGEIPEGYEGCDSGLRAWSVKETIRPARWR